MSPLRRNCLLQSSRLVSCLCFLALALALIHSHPPCSPLPLSILAPIAHPHPRPSSPPSLITAIAAASSRQRADAQCQHTGIYASPDSHLRILKHSRAWPFSLSLSLSLFTWGHLQTRHTDTILHYSTLPLSFVFDLLLSVLRLPFRFGLRPQGLLRPFSP